MSHSRRKPYPRPYPGTLTVWQGGKQLTGYEASVVLAQRYLALAAQHPAPAAPAQDGGTVDPSTRNYYSNPVLIPSALDAHPKC